jgi:stage VI sporulation protein D
MDSKGGAQVALQDGLLSFQIRETVFLSSDKDGIGELKELELQPDVEIIESPQEISITGCLQLHGKYEPYRQQTEAESGGSDSLVAAMKFTPFQLEENKSGELWYGTEQSLFHRIPLNISIPLSRIEEMSDIYAIIDSFDYHLENPAQLQIQAVLKIAGITMNGQADEQGNEEEEKWEFVHVANQQEEPFAEPSSLEEIERKLAELEDEIRLQEQSGHDKVVPVFAANDESYYHLPAISNAEQVHDTQPVSSHTQESKQESFGDVSESVDAESLWQEEHSVEPQFVALPDDSDTWNPELLTHADEEADQAFEPESEPAGGQEIAEVKDEAKEMKVAISSKGTDEPDAKVNITSIFTQAKRLQEAQAIDDEDFPSSSSSRRVTDDRDMRRRLEAMSNLTSFVRQSEEKMSRLRICIIQRSDTIESIAARYSMPISRILEVNNLTSDRISEGQILYIPQ